ncbi:hypothetical protein RUND412_002729 [Rhizina undulata]
MSDFAEKLKRQMDLLKMIRPNPYTVDTYTFTPMSPDGDPLEYFKSFPPDRQKSLLPLMQDVQHTLEKRALRAKRVFQKSKTRFTEAKKACEALSAENARLVENRNLDDGAKKAFDEIAYKSKMEELQAEFFYEQNGEKYLELFYKWEALRELLDEAHGELELERKKQAGRSSSRREEKSEEKKEEEA